MTDLRRRTDAKFICTIPDGATFMFLNDPDRLPIIGIMAHPDHLPRYVMYDGTTQEIVPTPPPSSSAA